MSDLRPTAGAGRFEVRATASDHFAWVRTRLSLERHDDGVAALRGGADRLRLCPRPIPQPLATNPRSPLRLSPNGAGISRARADFVRCPGACDLDLAVLVDGTLYVGRTVRAPRRTDKGGNAIAGF